MFFSYIIGGEDGYEVRWKSRLFYIRTAIGILPFHEAHHSDHFKTKFPSCLDSLHGGTSSRTHVIDNYNARAFFPEAFNALSSAVLLLRLTHQKAVYFSA